MAEVTINVRDNGCYRVEGVARIVDADGNEFLVEGESFALCRCGHSSKKPFCDGTHREIGFESVPRAEA